jgi:predicted RecB family endonuclease
MSNYVVVIKRWATDPWTWYSSWGDQLLEALAEAKALAGRGCVYAVAVRDDDDPTTALAWLDLSKRVTPRPAVRGRVTTSTEPPMARTYKRIRAWET